MDESTLKTGVDIASTISMAIPPPAGPIATTVLQIFGMFLPGPAASDANQKLLEEIGSLPQLIGNDAKLATAQAYASSVSAGVNRVQENWHDAMGEDYEAEAIDGLRVQFNNLYTVGNDVETALAALLNSDISGVAGYRAGRAALSAYFSLLLEYIIAKKVYVELSGAKVGLIDRSRRGGARATHRALREAVKQTRKDFDDLCNTVRDYTKPKGTYYPTMWGDATAAPFDGGFVGKLRKARADVVTVKTDGKNQDNEPATAELHYIDDPLGNPEKSNLVRDTYTYTALGPPTGGGTWSPNCLKSEVDNALPAYKQGVQDAFDSDMLELAKSYAKLLEQVGEVGDTLVPEDPARAITVEWVDVGQAGYWAVPKGKSVTWGIQFQNGSKSSAIVWSNWSDSPDGKQAPRLDLPCDSTASALTTSRTVWRLVRASPPGPRLPTGTDEPAEAIIVTLIPDNITATTWDFELEATAVLAPVPQQPPILGPNLAPAADGAPEAQLFSYCYGKTGSALVSPLSPDSPALIAKTGDTLVIPAQPDWQPRVFCRGAGDTNPTPAAGSLQVANSDGQSWTWTVG